MTMLDLILVLRGVINEVLGKERERHRSAAADVGNHQSGFKRKAKEVDT